MTTLMVGGFVIVAVSIVLLGVSLVHPLQFSQPAETLMLIGIGAIIIAELLPSIQSLKLGPSGIELGMENLSESTTDQILELRNRITRLELNAAARSTAGRKPSPWKRAPLELSQRGRFKNDPRKGRFGGSDVGKNLKLEADFLKSTKDWADVRLRVVPEKAGDKVDDVKAVQFFLHDSFNPDRVKVPMVEGTAELVITTWGGFTVGVWVPDRETTLELDLALLPNAPDVIRDR